MFQEQAVKSMCEAAQRIRAWAEATKMLAPEMARVYLPAMEREALRLEMDAAALSGEVDAGKGKVSA